MFNLNCATFIWIMPSDACSCTSSSCTLGLSPCYIHPVWRLQAAMPMLIVQAGPLLSLSGIRSRAAMLNSFGWHCLWSQWFNFSLLNNDSDQNCLYWILFLCCFCATFGRSTDARLATVSIDFVLRLWRILMKVLQRCSLLLMRFQKTHQKQDVIESLGETMGNPHETHGYSVLHLHCI